MTQTEWVQGQENDQQNSGFFQFLPNEIIEHICKLLIQSGNDIKNRGKPCREISRKLFHLSATCKFLRKLIGRFELKIPIIIWKQERNDVIKNKSSYLLPYRIKVRFCRAKTKLFNGPNQLEWVSPPPPPPPPPPPTKNKMVWIFLLLGWLGNIKWKSQNLFLRSYLILLRIQNFLEAVDFQKKINKCVNVFVLSSTKLIFESS